MPSLQPSRIPPYHLGRRVNEKTDRNLILLTTTLVNFLDLFQLSAVLFGLPDIQQALDFTSENVNWVLVVYSITFAALLLIGGQVGQWLGLEKTFIAGTAVLTISNIINAAAKNKATLLAGRAISGIGAGLTAPNGLAIISRTFPDGKARNTALAIYTACAPLGSTIGTVVASSVGWRSIFWICIILTGLALILACLFLPKFDRTSDLSIDVLGAVVFTIGVALLVYGVNDGSRSGWRSAPVLVGVILGACICISLVFIETKVTNPAIPRYVWRSGPFALMMFAIFAFGGSFSAWFFIVTQLCVNLLGYTPVLTAVYFLPGAFSAIASGALSAPMVRLIGEKGTLVLGLVITACGAVSWAFATPERAGGTPLAMVPAQSILLRHVESGSHAVAAALFNTAYQVGASVLLAGANALMNSQRESVGDMEVVAMEGYRNAFWLLTGVLGAGSVLIAVCYWPKATDEAPPKETTEPNSHLASAEKA
ncbi:hypothetical protein TrVFT333_009352 [Trichoderma virens FT-333]|nr:hypothetical protein TrVFT333_009352 [Trichoderma virens FT-333]